MPTGRWKYIGNHYTTKSCIFGSKYICSVLGFAREALERNTTELKAMHTRYKQKVVTHRTFLFSFGILYTVF